MTKSLFYTAEENGKRSGGGAPSLENQPTADRRNGGFA